MALTDDIRAAAARVAAAARHVHIEHDAIESYAQTLAAESPPAPDLEGAIAEARAAFSLQLNAINCGSGWFPELRKPRGLSGFRTMEAGLRRHRPWPADELAELTRAEVAEAFGQDSGHVLMGHYARHLNELGRRTLEEYGGSFETLARSGAGSAERLAATLATWDTWQDVSPYGDDIVPFFKRAQIAAADLALSGLAPADDLHRLTLFADNLVPHVLRVDGILRFAPGLVARIDREERLTHDSPEEVEIRACALHAVELLVQAHGASTATAVDNVLWNRGAAARYKSHPRHRAPCTAY